MEDNNENKVKFNGFIKYRVVHAVSHLLLLFMAVLLLLLLLFFDGLVLFYLQEKFSCYVVENKSAINSYVVFETNL